MVFVVPLMIIPGLLIQKPLAKLASEGMRELERATVGGRTTYWCPNEQVMTETS